MIMHFSKDIASWCRFRAHGFRSSTAIRRHSSKTSLRQRSETIDRQHNASIAPLSIPPTWLFPLNRQVVGQSASATSPGSPQLDNRNDESLNSMALVIANQSCLPSSTPLELHPQART